MFEIGKKAECFGVELLKPQDLGFSRPTELPPLGENEKTIAGYDQGLGERLIVCETVEDMQKLFDAKNAGGCLRLHWYVGPDPGFVKVSGK